MVLMNDKFQIVHSLRNVHRKFTEPIQDSRIRSGRANEQNFVLLEDANFFTLPEFQNTNSLNCNKILCIYHIYLI